MQNHTIIVEEEEAGERLDRCLSRRLPAFSRSRLQQLIAQGCVKSGQSTVTDSARKVKPGETYMVQPPLPVAATLAVKAAELEILYEDEHILIINKPAGMTVHPAPGHADDTLVNALLAHCGNSLSGIGGVMRPGIVHRIDKDTSGLLVVAKHDTAHRHLSAQLAERTLKREYLAVVKGRIVPPAGKIEGNIGRSSTNRKKMAVVKNGKPAVTHYTTLTTFAEASLVRCKLETGRTHQIRVHLTHIGHPLLGDPVYGRKQLITGGFARQALHACDLTLIHPHTLEIMQFHAEIPRDMKRLLESLAAT